jgi:hypothetical protein
MPNGGGVIFPLGQKYVCLSGQHPILLLKILELDYSAMVLVCDLCLQDKILVFVFHWFLLLCTELHPVVVCWDFYPLL